MIHLTYLITDLKVGGVPLHLYRLATHLPKDRFKVRVISLADLGPVGGMLRQAGIPVVGCNARGAWDLRVLWRLHSYLRVERVDILHALLFHANIAARIIGPIAELSFSRILCEIQTVERERPWHLIADNLTCRCCAYEIGNSPSVIEHLHQSAHIPYTRLTLEMGGVEFDKIASAAPIAGVSRIVTQPDEFFIVWVGRFDPIKGFEEMLAAFARVSSAKRAKFVLVGDGPYRPAIERLIDKHQLQDHVLLLGERSDVPSILKAADLFLFCSRTEGLPNAVLEAMAAGLAIVATNIPGCRDLIQDGKTGVLVDPGSVNAIAGAVESLIDNPARRKALGDAAQGWVRGYMDVSALVNRMVHRYEQLGSEAGQKSLVDKADIVVE